MSVRRNSHMDQRDSKTKNKQALKKLKEKKPISKGGWVKK